GFGELARALGSLSQYVPDGVGPARELGPARVDDGEALEQMLDQPALAVQTADAGRAASLGGPRLRWRRRERLVQIEDRALLGRAGIGAALARRVRHHRLER